MPHDKDHLLQRAGYIVKANGWVQEQQDLAKKARAEGRDRAAKYHEGRAATYTKRIDTTARNMKTIIKSRPDPER